MMNRFMLAGVVAAGILILGAGETPSGTIAVKVTGLRSDDGQVLAYLFDQKKGFPTKPAKAVAKRKAGIEEGRAFVSFKDVVHGTYAVSVIHDEDGDGKIDTYILGIPKEGVGVSMNAKGKAGPPKFEDAKFVLDSDTRKLTIKIRYL
jgi:uncharacterized protein (DUF2141 family)